VTDDSYERKRFSVTAVAEFPDLESAREAACVGALILSEGTDG
jgi:hypothetical protein